MTAIVLLPIVMAITIYRQIKFEYVASIVLLGTTLMSYICGATIGFIWEKYFLCFLALVSIVYMVKNNAGKTYELWKEHAFSVITYALIFVWLLVVMRNRGIIDKDSQLVWARFAKEFSYVGRINRYSFIPGMISWNTLSLFFWPNDSDTVLLVGQNFFTIYLLISIFAEVKVKDFFSKIAFVIVIILLPCLSRAGYGYYSLALDTFISILTAYTLIKARKFLLKRDEISTIELCMGLAVLVLTKKAGLILALIILMILLCCEAFSNNTDRMSKRFWSVFVKAIISTLGPLLSWDLVRAMFSNEQPTILYYSSVFFRLIGGSYLKVISVIISALLLLVIMAFLIKKKYMIMLVVLVLASLMIAFVGVTLLIPYDIRQRTVLSFLNCIFVASGQNPVLGFGHAILIPFYIIIIVVDVCWLFMLKGEHYYVKQIDKVFIIWANMGFMIYALSVYYANLSTRSIEQTARAAECNRYLYTYILIFVILGIYKVLVKAYKKGSITDTIIVTMMIVFLATSNYPTATFKKITTYYAEFINLDENDTLYLVDQMDKVDKYLLYYLLTPGNYNYEQDDKLLKNKNGNDMSLEEWKGYLLDYRCTYVYVFSIDNEFEYKYGSLFMDPIKPKTLYSVEYVGNDIQLKYYYCFEGA